jgi:hypothetical protein
VGLKIMDGIEQNMPDKPLSLPPGETDSLEGVVTATPPPTISAESPAKAAPGEGTVVPFTGSKKKDKQGFNPGVYGSDSSV